MARKMNFGSDDGDGDDHIIATFGDVERCRHISDRYELRHGLANGCSSVKERISLCVREAFESPPPPRMLAPGFRHDQQLQTRSATEDTIMNRNKLMITFLSVAAFAVGCNREETASQQLDKVQEKTAEAARDMKDYTYAQKAQFVEKMQLELAGLNRELDQLAARIEKSSDAVKAEAKPKLQALRDQTARLNKHLDEVRNATESTWDSVKNGFKKTYESSKDGFQQARQWVSDKLAP